MNFLGKSIRGSGQVNEDSYGTLILGKSLILVIADGIGGEKGGEIASSIALKTSLCLIKERMGDRIDSIGFEEFGEKMTLIFRDVNKEILLRALQDNDLLGMGSTLTVAVISGREVRIAHIGDSRAYLIHGSNITRMTEDHTYASKLLSESSITREEYEKHPGRNKLVRSLGENAYISPDLYRYNIIYGDMVLLCTDGVHGFLGDQQIVSSLKMRNDLEGCLDGLLEAASEKGSEDDKTAVLAHVRPLLEKE